MGFFKDIIGGDEPKVESAEDEFYSVSKEEYHQQNGMAGSKMMLLEPRAYSEGQQIVDYLKARSAVVVNLKRVTPDQAKRIIDFLYGAIYAIDGKIQKLGGGIFLCTPRNVNVEGNISDDNAANTANTKNNRGKKEDDDEDFF